MVSWPVFEDGLPVNLWVESCASAVCLKRVQATPLRLSRVPLN